MLSRDAFTGEATGVLLAVVGSSCMTHLAKGIVYF